MPLNVLVVEDETLLRWSIAELLRRGGHHVIEVADAAGARDRIADASGRLDVVLLDCRLPDSCDGCLFEEIRDRLPHAAVVLMTAFGTPEFKKAALDRGVYCVLNKPFDMRDLEPVLLAACRAARSR